MEISLTLCSENVLTYVGGWVVQRSLKTPLRNIKMAPDDGHKYFHCTVIIYQRK